MDRTPKRGPPAAAGVPTSVPSGHPSPLLPVTACPLRKHSLSRLSCFPLIFSDHCESDTLPRTLAAIALTTCTWFDQSRGAGVPGKVPFR